MDRGRSGHRRAETAEIRDQNLLDGIDWDAFLRERVEIRNADGGRNYTGGNRVFDCPWCDDRELRRGRGWMHVLGGVAGCFNVGCDAHPRVEGGAVEWARAWENFPTRAETVAFLRAKYRGFVPAKPAPPQAYVDFCLFPPEMRRFRLDPSHLQLSFEKFAVRKWGLDLADLMGAGAGWCASGRYARRIIFPVVMGGKPVGFQARTIGAAAAKYLTSSCEDEGDRKAECGRPAEAMIYGLDGFPPGQDLVVVEGIPDSLRGRKDGLWAAALLGTALTREKLALIALARPGRVLIGLDEEPETAPIALEMVDALTEQGIPAERCGWEGGKDAGSGATLVRRPDPLRAASRLLRRA